MTTTATPAAIPDPAVLLARVEELRDRHEVVDALLRFAAGQDLDDRDAILSAFAPMPRSTSPNQRGGSAPRYR
jgi:hypothetical protein